MQRLIVKSNCGHSHLELKPVGGDELLYKMRRGGQYDRLTCGEGHGDGNEMIAFFSGACDGV